MMAFIFGFDPRKGQGQVKLGQRLNSKFSYKTFLARPVLSQVSKLSFIFY